MHLDNLGSAYDVEILGATLVLLQQLKDALLVTKKHDTAILAHLLECHHSTLYGYFRGEVATHSINTDLYHNEMFCSDKKQRESLFWGGSLVA